MDFMTVFTEHFVEVVVLACLLVGYAIKTATFFKWIPNDDIPVILGVIGIIANFIYSGVSFSNAAYGALMGVASTGLHQGFKAFVKRFGGSTDEATEEEE